MTRKLDKLFELKVKIPLMRHGKSQRIETLINEEALLLAKYLRDEKKTYRSKHRLGRRIFCSGRNRHFSPNVTVLYYHKEKNGIARVTSQLEQGV